MISNSLLSRPDLISEWHPAKNTNLSPNMITLGSNRKIWWICNKGHEFQQIVNSRIRRNRKCPYCCGQKACKENCLAITDVASEFHPVKNNPLTIYNITPSSDKIIWWICRTCNFEWKSRVANRTCLKNGCPNCHKPSRGEAKICSILQKHNQSFLQQYRTNCRDKKPLPFDFCINHPNKILLIEYQGREHYELVNFGGRMTIEKMEKQFAVTKHHDQIKTDYCIKNNIPLLCIPYWEFKNIEKIVLDFLKT